jgi:hypothetical protein
MFGWTFDQTIDAAALVTFITLTAGFLAWTAKTFQELRRDSMREADDGALRLLLKILRERYVDNQTPIELSELRTEFEKPERKAERKAYGGGQSSSSRTTLSSNGRSISSSGSPRSTSMTATGSCSGPVPPPSPSSSRTDGRSCWPISTLTSRSPPSRTHLRIRPSPSSRSKVSVVSPRPSTQSGRDIPWRRL